VEQETERDNRTRSLVDAFAAIREGDLSQTWLARFSDLPRDGAKTFRREWAMLPETLRVDVVRRFDTLSEEHVELNFGRALRVALDDPSPVVRQLAIAGLWEDESGELLARLRGILRDDPSPDVRSEAASALGRFSQRASVETLPDEATSGLRDDLVRATQSSSSSYAEQRRALESLGPFGVEPEVSAAIQEAFESGDHGLQCSAVRAMGLSRESRWLPMILSELQSEEPELRFEAARSAGLMGSTDALPLLLDAARDDDPEVRHTAINAIAQIGGRGAARALERLAEDASEADLELIDAALEEVGTLLEPFEHSS
jgi:HEAT repeat protein